MQNRVLNCLFFISNHDQKAAFLTIVITKATVNECDVLHVCLDGNPSLRRKRAALSVQNSRTSLQLPIYLVTCLITWRSY